jgi:hypothetical protein
VEITNNNRFNLTQSSSVSQVKQMLCFKGGTMKFDIQRLRNLTTGKLHTKIDHVYEDLEKIIGESGIMTHMIPRVMKSVDPWLKENVHDARFWDGKFDTSHTGEIELPTPTDEERKSMFERFEAMPNPLEGKEVIAVVV